MIPNSFSYYKAGSVDEAIQLMQQHDDAHLLAGGHSLIPSLKLRLSAPGALIDIGHLADLKSIKKKGQSLVIGANVTHYMLESSKEVAREAAALAESASLIGDVQVRNKGTIGGSIAHADPSADYPAVLLALGATIEVQGPEGSREVPASAFFVDLYTTSLEEGEIVTGVHIPAAGPKDGSAYAKFMQPASRFAVVGCAAAVTVEGGNVTACSVAFNGVCGAAFLDDGVAQAMIGQPANAASAEAASKHACANAEDILSDIHASEDYRVHLATVYARKALQAALVAAN